MITVTQNPAPGAVEPEPVRTEPAAVLPSVPALLEALAAARVEGLSLDTALLAALIVARHHTTPAEAIDLAKYRAFDERCEAAGAERERLIEAAGAAFRAAEYAETPAEVTP